MTISASDMNFLLINLTLFLSFFLLVIFLEFLCANLQEINDIADIQEWIVHQCWGVFVSNE